MPNTSTVVLIVAHGSRNPKAVAEHEQFCAQVAGAVGLPADEVRPAYLEISDPSVPTAIEQAVEAGATRIRILPHFLNSGNHVMVDIPGIVDAARSSHPGVEIELDRHLGAHPGLVQLTADILETPTTGLKWQPEG